MSDAVKRLRAVCVGTAVDGTGKASHKARRAAYANADDVPARALIEKVAVAAWTVTDEDVAAAKVGLSEDEVFELAVCAAIGQSDRQLEAALAVLDEVEA